MYGTQKKSTVKNGKYSFKIYHYGDLIDTKYFDTYESAQNYYLLTYYDLEVATVPYIDGRQMTFMEAYKFYEAGNNLKYNYARTKNGYTPNN